MTEIEFHFNTPDKLGYCTRLLRKIYRAGERAVVTAEPELLANLDQFLWTFSPSEFLPHCLGTADARNLDASPIVLAEQVSAGSVDSLLINLGQRVPADFERFHRLIEVVSAQDEDRLSGRSRWKHYRDRGYALNKHDLSGLAGAS